MRDSDDGHAATVRSISAAGKRHHRPWLEEHVTGQLDDIQTYVRNEAQGINNPSALTVQTSWNPNNSPGSTVNVQVSYSYHPFYPFNDVTLPLSSSAQMVISH
jgi:hypothetical protein